MAAIRPVARCYATRRAASVAALTAGGLKEFEKKLRCKSGSMPWRLTSRAVVRNSATLRSGQLETVTVDFDDRTLEAVDYALGQSIELLHKKRNPMHLASDYVLADHLFDLEQLRKRLAAAQPSRIELQPDDCDMIVTALSESRKRALSARKKARTEALQRTRKRFHIRLVNYYHDVLTELAYAQKAISEAERTNAE
jgi:hypothetical protein